MLQAQHALYVQISSLAQVRIPRVHNSYHHMLHHTSAPIGNVQTALLKLWLADKKARVDACDDSSNCWKSLAHMRTLSGLAVPAHATPLPVCLTWLLKLQSCRKPRVSALASISLVHVAR